MLRHGRRRPPGARLRPSRHRCRRAEPFGDAVEYALTTVNPQRALGAWRWRREPRPSCRVRPGPRRAPQQWRTWSSTTARRARYSELLRNDDVAAWLICWMDEQDTGFHDHDVSAGAVGGRRRAACARTGSCSASSPSLARRAGRRSRSPSRPPTSTASSTRRRARGHAARVLAAAVADGDLRGAARRARCCATRCPTPRSCGRSTSRRERQTSLSAGYSARKRSRPRGRARSSPATGSTVAGRAHGRLDRLGGRPPTARRRRRRAARRRTRRPRRRRCARAAARARDATICSHSSRARAAARDAAAVGQVAELGDQVERVAQPVGHALEHRAARARRGRGAATARRTRRARPGSACGVRSPAR